MFVQFKYLITLFISVMLLTGTACSNSAKASRDSDISSPEDTVQYGWDRPGMMVNGHQVPVYFEKEFGEALKAAKFEMGELSHGIWFWDRDGKFYNLEGKEHKWE